MMGCCEQAERTNYILEGALPSFVAGFAMSQRRFFISVRLLSPRNVIYAVSGLREWDLIRIGIITRGCSPPNPFGGSGESRQNLFTPHHILEWGAKTAVLTRGWLYELPSGSRNHILELREKICYQRHDNCMSGIALSTKLHRNPAY